MSLFPTRMPQGARSRLVVLTTALSLSLSPVVQAQDLTGLALAQFIDDRGGAARINFSGKLRMLSQRITAAACLRTAGAEADTSSKILSASTEEFANILAALEVGDESLGITGAEDRKKTLVGLKVAAEKFAPMKAAVDDLLAGGDPQAALAILYESNGPLLATAQKLVTEISGQYSDPNAMSQAGALGVDLAGRQRMLSQKMVKLACQISTGTATPEDTAELTKSIGIYDTTLVALIDGMADAGVQPAPTPEIKDLLTAIQTDWKAIQPQLEGVAAGAPLDTAGLGALLLSVDKLLGAMNESVALYAKASSFKT